MFGTFLAIGPDRTVSQSERNFSQLRTRFKATQKLFVDRIFLQIILARVSDANATLAVVAHNACQQRVRLQHEPCQRESLRGSYGPTRARATHTSSLATSKRSTRAPRPGGLDPPPPGHHRRALSKADSKSWPLECRNSQLERPTLTSDVGRVVVGASAAPAREPRAAWV